MRSCGSLVVVVSLTALLSTGCARKKAPPERGTVIGSARFSPVFALDKFETDQLDPDLHCMQLVKLREDQSKVIEISAGSCPKSQSPISSQALSDQVIATLRLTSIGDQPGIGQMLTMGDSSKESQNTPVGVYKDVSTDKEQIVQIDSLCENYQNRIRFSDFCRIDFKEGRIESIKLIRKMSIDSVVLGMGITNLENADQIKASIALANEDLKKIKSRLTTADDLLKKLESRIKSDDRAVKTLSSLIEATSESLDTLKQKHQEFTTESNKELTELDERIKDIKGRYVSLVSQETNDKLMNLDTQIKETNDKLSKLLSQENGDQINALDAKMKASNAALAALLAEENKSKIEKLNSLVKEAGDKHADLVSDENRQKLDALNRSISETSKKLADSVSTIETKIVTIQERMTKLESELNPKSEEAKQQLTEMREMSQALAKELREHTAAARAELEQLGLRKKSVLEIEMAVLLRARKSLLEEKNEAEVDPSLDVQEVLERAAKVEERILEVTKMIAELK